VGLNFSSSLGGSDQRGRVVAARHPSGVAAFQTSGFIIEDCFRAAKSLDRGTLIRRKGVAHVTRMSLNEGYRSPKEKSMKIRLTRSFYLLSLLAAFVVASGAGHKFGA